jgi:ABC-type nitrate/sulfonate/bicarbonate transport system substrate-binding protein
MAAVVMVVGIATTSFSTASSAGAAKNSTKPESSSLTVPLPGASAAVGYFVFAADEDIYGHYGLSVSAPVSDSNTVRSGFIAGSTPFAQLGAIDTLTLLAAGVKVKILGCQQSSVPFQMWAKNEIKTAKDLKGKNVGVSTLTGATGVATLKYLDANGVKPSDVNIVPLGSVPSQLAALTSGRLDAALLSYPAYQSAAAAGGLHKIGDAPLAPNIYVADADWAKTHHNTIVAYLKGNTEGLVAYATDRTAALPVLAKLLRLNLDDPTQGATVKEGYQLYHAAYTPIHECEKATFDEFVPYLTPEAQATLQKPGKFLDNSYLQELETSGFYAKLTKKYGAFPGIPQ